MKSLDSGIRDLLSRALQFESGTSREDFLDEQCASNPGLRAAVARRLRALELEDLTAVVAETRDAADSPAENLTSVDIGWVDGTQGTTAARPGAIEPIGSDIGPYRLIQKLGEGGMGTVFLAEQKEPVRRRVALKIIKPGMDSHQVVARFKAERQALAMMEHPNIAKVLDAGTTDQGRPFFVMELVHGVPITTYCDAKRLSPMERLELFVPVCQAIQHAHQKGIIHRDIKPSNVLVSEVDGQPVAKVIDFGVAKAINQALTERSLYTQLGAIVGTPEYMSPEQAGMGSIDVDTRTDIYALGVLLYELLTGDTPLMRASLRSAGFAEVINRIKEEEPPAPSSRLATLAGALPAIASARSTDPTRLTRMLKGDLDWIVMKALEKDRVRRYETASSFARDIERYIRNEPVEASPPSRIYRIKKFVGRHKAGLATTALIATVLLGATVISTWQAWRATKAEQLAHREVANFKEMDRFLTQDLLMQARPDQNAVEDNVSLLQVLDRASQRVETRFEGKPELEVRLRKVIAMTYGSLGAYSKALSQFERAAAAAVRFYGANSPETWIARSGLAYGLMESSQHDKALTLATEAKTQLARLLGPEHSETLNARLIEARILYRMGRANEALPLLKVLATYDGRTDDNADFGALEALNVVGLIHINRADYSLAESTLRELLARSEKRFGAENPSTLLARTNLAGALRQQGKTQDAKQLLEETIAIKTRVFGPQHVHTLAAKNGLAHCLFDENKFAEAEAIYRENWNVEKATLGEDQAPTLYTQTNLSSVMSRQGKVDEAEALARDAYERAMRALGPDHVTTFKAQAEWSARLQDLNRPNALQVAEEVLPKARRINGPGHPETLRISNDLGLLYQQLGRPADAERVLRVTLEGKLRRNDDPKGLIATKWNLALALIDLNQLDEASALCHEVLQHRRDSIGRENVETLVTLYNLVLVEQRRGRWAEAEPLIDELYAIQKKYSPRTSMYLIINTAQLARNKLELGKLDGAEALAREYHDMVSNLPADNWMKAHADCLLGRALAMRGDLETAKPLLKSGHEGLVKTAAKIQPWSAIDPQVASDWLGALVEDS